MKTRLLQNIFNVISVTISLTKIECFCLFIIKNQQFITRSARADRGSYFVTTLIRTKRGERERKEKKRKKTNNETINIIARSPMFLPVGKFHNKNK